LRNIFSLANPKNTCSKSK